MSRVPKRPVLTTLPITRLVNQGTIRREGEVPRARVLVVFLLVLIVVWAGDVRLEASHDAHQQHGEGHDGYHQDRFVGDGVVEEVVARSSPGRGGVLVCASVVGLGDIHCVCWLGRLVVLVFVGAIVMRRC